MNDDLKNKLEIFIITYNRKKYLEKTLKNIFNDDSPIKELSFTILDNCSDDGTSELIELYSQQYHNIKHIIHHRNIGGNANICRAFEMATYPYVWVLCDDDEYDWSHWDEVERAISDNKDLIVVSNYIHPEESDINLIKQLTFVPAAIYKTKYFSSGMMINAYYNISIMFPQLSVASVYINKKLDIYICKNWIVNMVINEEDASYSRGVTDVKPHKWMNENIWDSCFCVASYLFEDENLRNSILDSINVENCTRYDGYYRLIEINNQYYNSSLKNLSQVFCAINKEQKIDFFRAIINFYGKDKIYELLRPYRDVFYEVNYNKYNRILEKFIKVCITPQYINLMFFNFIIIYVWKYNWIHLRKWKRSINIVLFDKVKIRIWSKDWFKKNNI